LSKFKNADILYDTCNTFGIDKVWNIRGRWLEGIRGSERV